MLCLVMQIFFQLVVYAFNFSKVHQNVIQLDKKLLKHPTFVEYISLKLYACGTYVYYFSPGYFCDNANGPIGNLSNYECPMGYYCPGSVNRSNEYPCSAGTYNNRTMLVSDSECQPCLPGYYCQNPGLPEPEGLCYPG